MALNIYAPSVGDGIESEELKLYNLINTYRQQYGLPPIALSASLSLVANRHVRDLQENVGYLTHGWSDAPYSSSDPSTWPNMWSAPQRFNTAYTGYGYENAYRSSAGATAEGALKSWQSSSGHNAVILNLGTWADNGWNAIGIGIYGNYAVMWVGEQIDPAGSPIGSGSTIDPDQYGASYGDLIQAFGYNPTAFLNHYNKVGKFEGRQPDRFDELRYLASNADLIQVFGYNLAAVTKHYIQHGFYEKRSLTQFQASQYLASYGDLISAFGYDLEAATKHYIQNGFKEKRSADAFNEAIYLASYGDLISAFGYNLEAATKHYIQNGFKEKRSIDLFSPINYLNNYADLQAAFGNDLNAATRHYIDFGYYEGRSHKTLALPDISLPGLSAPTSVFPEQSFIIGTNIYNLGNAQVSNSQVRFYLSNDQILDNQDIVLGTQNIQSLLPNSSTYVYLNATRNTAWGTGDKFILGKVDYANLLAESNEANNFFARTISLVGPYISVSWPNGSNALEAGKNYVINWTDNISENVRIKLYQNGSYLLTVAESTASDGNYTWTAPTFSNTINNFQIRIESTTSNGIFDMSDGVFSITVPALPDLSISAFSIPSSVAIGDSIVIGATVFNQGSGNAANSYLHYYLSNNTVWDTQDIFLGENYVIGIEPGSKINKTHSFVYQSAYGTGTKYLLLVADPQGTVAESNELNNVAYQVVTAINKPTLTLSSPSNWGGGMLRVGQIYNLTWNDTISENVKIDLYKGSQYLQTIVTTTASDGSYYWSPATTLQSGRDYQIRIASTTDTTLYDFSDSFSISDLSTYKPFNTNTVFSLNSNLGANHTIYLDFDGHTTTGSYWNTQYGVSSIVTPAYDTDGISSSFSTVEREQIWRIWQRVAEDFAPFDVNVTTALPTLDQLTNSGGSDSKWGIRVVIGGDGQWTGNTLGGKAQYNSFNYSGDVPAFVFSKNFSGGDRNIAESISHEVGHTLGLNHDGTSNPAGPMEYYEGHGSGATGWAPIMGVGYYKELTQWSRGEYSYATNQQNDLDVITGSNGFGYRADDYGDSLANAMDFFSDAVNVYGIIEKNTDYDYFKFWSSTGVISLSIKPFERDPNLDILAKLYNASGQVVRESNPLGSLEASFNVQLGAGQYYLSVTGVGEGGSTNGYSDYGSLGQYSITGHVNMPVVEL